MAKASDTTELKLATTATQGVAGEHSPYYRRLLSAGYKGYIQGMLGGAGYYGMLGAAVGTLVGVPLLLFTGPMALMIIPAAAGAGIIKGANTFGNIGSTAAINAESADMSEQRRTLLDRLSQLPEGPESAQQAAIINEQLYRIEHPSDNHPLFHWKTVLICAALGAVAAFAFSAALPVGAALMAGSGTVATESFLAAGLTTASVHLTALATAMHLSVGPLLTMAGTALGAAIGGTIGIDRHYVRRWFDGTEKVLYDESHVQDAVRERQIELQRLHNAAIDDAKTATTIERVGRYGGPHLETPQTGAPVIIPQREIAAITTAELDQPDTKINAAQYQSRLADIQKAMAVPAV